jgi:hypothetical protein
VLSCSNKHEIYSGKGIRYILSPRAHQQAYTVKGSSPSKLYPYRKHQQAAHGHINFASLFAPSIYSSRCIATVGLHLVIICKVVEYFDGVENDNWYSLRSEITVGKFILA